MARYPRDENEIPQLRSFSAKKTGGTGRILAWVILMGSVGVLVLAVGGKFILPAVGRLIPSRYIVAYAPESIQNLMYGVDPLESLPEAATSGDDAQQLLQDIQASVVVEATQDAALAVAELPAVATVDQVALFAQPTSIAVAPTPTVTPAFVPAAADRAVTDGEAADLTQANALLTGFTHTYQGWNNCGPATITTTLSYYVGGFTQNQAQQFLKPNLEDRNVRPDELVAYARSVGYDATFRVNGDLQLIKTLIASGYPVIVEKGFDPEPDRLGWMGHYLLLAGYSDEEQAFVTMDSYLGPNRSVTYADTEKFWRQFNHTYIVVHRPDQATAVASIIGEEMDDFTMYTNALYNAQAEINLNNSDPFAWFNLGSNLVALGRYQQAATAFDEARRTGTPWRMLWYQFGPYEAYYQVGRYEDVLTLADATIANNPYAEESFYFKALVYQDRGQLPAARRELETALRNNSNYSAAQIALNQVISQLG